MIRKGIQMEKVKYEDRNYVFIKVSTTKAKSFEWKKT